MEYHHISLQPKEVVKECAICGELKEYRQFFKDRHSDFRDYKGEPDETGVSADCRTCRLKKNHD